MEEKDYKIVKFKNNRFAISDLDGNIIDDAQGYGYTSKQKAHKAMWYKFKGGKQKIQEKIDKAKSWINKTNKNKKAFKELGKMFESWFKEVARGEVTNEEIIQHVQTENDIIFPDYVIEYFFKH